MHDNAIDLPTAPFLVRIAAMIYELLLVIAVSLVASLIFLFPYFLYLFLVGHTRTGWLLLPGWLHPIFQLYLLGVLFAYFSAFWLRSGQTLAMKTWRIRLENMQGGKPSLRQAGVRFILALIGLLLAGAGLWWAWFDRDRQFLHDRIAGTRLVRVDRKV